MNSRNNTRLLSLDILRGADMWLLLFAGPIIHTLVECTSNPIWDPVRHQVYHPEWYGFVLWDIIMPLFMFLSGVTIPFSMARYRNGEKPGKQFWLKLLKRFTLLFVIGWIVQGNLLNLDFKLFHPFANTLQAIAVGYVVMAIAYAYGGSKWQIIIGSICFMAYFLAFALSGQLTPDQQDNIAMVVDKAILGSHRDGVTFAADGSWAYYLGYKYTWILSSLNFCVTVMLGSLSGQILKGENKKGNAIRLAAFGAILLIAGLLLGLVFPIIKKIWSSSMVLYAGGISALLLAFTYYIVDVLGWNKGLGWFRYYGANAISAYFIGEVFTFSSVTASVLFGFEQFLGLYYPVLIATANSFILLFILKYLYRKNIFIRV